MAFSVPMFCESLREKRLSYLLWMSFIWVSVNCVCSSHNHSPANNFLFFSFRPFHYYYKLKHLSSFFCCCCCNTQHSTLPASIYARNYLIIKLVPKARKRHKQMLIHSVNMVLLCAIAIGGDLLAVDFWYLVMVLLSLHSSGHASFNLVLND